jgi:hypothetical protein
MTQNVNVTTPARDKLDLQAARRPHQPKRKIELLALRWWLYILFVFGYLILFFPSAQYPNIVIITLLPSSLALWFGILLLLGNGGTRKIYDPMTLFNTGLFYYSLKGVALSWGDRTTFLSHISMEQVEQIYPYVALMTSAGIVLWNWGYNNFQQRVSNRVKLQAPTQKQNVPDEEYGRYVNPRLGVFFLILIGTFSFYFLIQNSGGDLFVFLFNSWRRGYLSDTNLTGSASAFSSLFLPGMLLLPLASILWLAVLGGNRQRPGLFFGIYTALMFVALFLVMPRATLLGSLLSLLFVYHYKVQRIGVTVMAILGAIAVVYSYAVNVWRGFAWSVSDLQEAGLLLAARFSLRDIPDFLVSGAISDIRTFVLIAHHYGNDVPLRYGATLLRIFTQFVPRAFWPAKPLDLGVELGRLSNPLSISGTPAGFVPEMYLNFHVVGVLIGTFLLGLAMNFIYQSWVLSSNREVLPIVLYAISIPRILLLPSSTISLAFVSLAIPIGAVLVAMWLCDADKDTIRKPSPRPRR